MGEVGRGLETQRVAFPGALLLLDTHFQPKYSTSLNEQNKKRIKEVRVEEEEDEDEIENEYFFDMQEEGRTGEHVVKTCS
ncbi:hypothetical protein M0802_009962 [Mischocyttarus mexicanus]|nr:hypothetical protein M0802_009962 [Mischocyttarus mexicanus]